MSTDEATPTDTECLSVGCVLVARRAYRKAIGDNARMTDWIVCGRGTFAVVYVHPRDPSLVVKVFDVPRLSSTREADATRVPESTVARHRSERELLARLRKADDARACFPFMPESQPPPSTLMFVMERGLCGLEDLPKYALYGDAAPRATRGFVFPHLSQHDVEHLLYRMIECVHVAHENGVSHLDVKPSNFIIRLYRKSRMRELMRTQGATSRHAAIMGARVVPGSYSFPCADTALAINRDADDICMDVFLADWGESRLLCTPTGDETELMRGATYTTLPYRAPELMTLSAVRLTRDADAWGLGCCAVDVAYQLMRAPVFDIDCLDTATVSPEELAEISNRMLCRIAGVLGVPRSPAAQDALRAAHAAVHATFPADTSVAAITAEDNAVENGAAVLDLDCINGHLLHRGKRELSYLKLRRDQFASDSEEHTGTETAIQLMTRDVAALSNTHGCATPISTKRLILSLLEWNPAERVQLGDVLTNQRYWSQPLERVRAHCVPRVSTFHQSLIVPCKRANDSTKTIGDSLLCVQSIIRYLNAV